MLRFRNAKIPNLSDCRKVAEITAVNGSTQPEEQLASSQIVSVREKGIRFAIEGNQHLKSQPRFAIF